MSSMNSGYYGYSMSINAHKAYQNHEMPLSKWTKKAILEEIARKAPLAPLEQIKKYPLVVLRDTFLVECGWHHTGKYCNRTYFYSVDTYFIDDLPELPD